MQTRMRLFVAVVLGMWAAGGTEAQITSNPVPTPIAKRGLAVEVRDLVRLPDTRAIRPAELVQLFPLSADVLSGREKDGTTYPVAMYDHDEGRAITDGIPQTLATIEEVQLYVRDAQGNRVDVSMQTLVNRAMGSSLPRADLHISRTRDGELLLTSRQDGFVRMLVP